MASLFANRPKRWRRWRFLKWWRRSGRSRQRTQSEARRVKMFVEWCREVGIQLHPHVSVQREGTCDGLGVIAKDVIKKGECVALIPRTALLSCANSKVRSLVEANDRLLDASWVPLLLALAAEYSYKTDSQWHPYLSIVPATTSSLPMLWAESVRNSLLEGSVVDCWVSNDLQRIEKDYDSLVKPFVAQHPQLQSSLPDCEHYKKLVAYVMAYSFTDSSAGPLDTTMMVPFVDLLNHSSEHHVELTFHPKHLKLMAVRTIAKGQEVMNTYGDLSNAALLHKYGFTEKDNPYDHAVVPSQQIRDVYLQHYSDPSRWETALSLDVVEEEYSIAIDGAVEADLLMLIRLLCSKANTKKSMQACLQAISIQDCTRQELGFLKRVVHGCLDVYPEQVSTDPGHPMSTRERHCWQVVLGQQNSLRKLYNNL